MFILFLLLVSDSCYLFRVKSFSGFHLNQDLIHNRLNLPLHCGYVYDRLFQINALAKHLIEETHYHYQKSSFQVCFICFLNHPHQNPFLLIVYFPLLSRHSEDLNAFFSEKEIASQEYHPIHFLIPHILLPILEVIESSYYVFWFHSSSHYELSLWYSIPGHHWQLFFFWKVQSVSLSHFSNFIHLFHHHLLRSFLPFLKKENLTSNLFFLINEVLKKLIHFLPGNFQYDD